MALDGIILSKVNDELNSRLPIRINRITQVSQNEIVFNIHSNKQRNNLIISCHSVYNRIHLTNREYTGYDTPSGFIMLLRKHILNGIIYKIEQFDYDRYLVLHIKALDDLYDEKEYKLYVELMGKYANIILVDAVSNKILDALKRIPPFENSKRIILAGANFVGPDKQHKQDPFITNSFDEEIPLLKQFQGFSPLLEKEIHYRLQTQSFKEIMDEIANSHKLYIAFNKDNAEYHIIPLTHMHLDFESYDINEGFDAIYYQLEERERIKHVTNDLFKYTKRQIKHYNQKLAKLNDSLIEAKNCDDLRNFGDLLYMYPRLNDKGLKSVEVEDYEGNLVNVKLDAKLNIKENANKYYNLYQKKRKSEKYLLEQIDIASNELEFFTSIEEQLTLANYQDALMIKEELVKFGYIKAQIKKKKKKQSEWHLYQIEFNGHLITFGKNNLQNEALTFDYAKNNYTWFHAQQYHGAHLCVDTDTPDEATIRYCANLAAWFSKGRFSSSVPIDYCLAKDVKKIKGSKAGLVQIKNYKTIFIDPDRVDETIIKHI